MIIEALKSGYDFFLHITSSAPPPLWAIVLSLLVSMVFTQWAKFWFPLAWPTRARAAFAQAIAFATGFGACTALWPTLYGGFVGVVIGCASPTLYAIAVRVVGIKYPSIRDLLSADVREGEK